MKIESAMKEGYAARAKTREAELHCAVSYDPEFLIVIPDEVGARNSACGDPSRWLREAVTPLDLGSGSAKIDFIVAQVAD